VEALALVESIPGWLRSEDADKLWELARSTPGPILEIGTYHGKSAVLMALARKEIGGGGPLYTLDVDGSVLRAAKAEAGARAVADLVVFIRGTSAAFARAYPHLRPALTFVDGDHTRRGVERDLAVPKALVPESGRMLFHDFYDPGNEDLFQVRPAVEGSWVARECDFDGVFGCCGLFTRRAGGPRGDAAIADLLRLDSARDQYLHRLRYPAARLWRRMR
jgi:methyltransferase family protein